MKVQLGNKLGNGHLVNKMCIGQTDLLNKMCIGQTDLLNNSLKKQAAMMTSGWNSPTVCSNTGLRIISNCA
jgi:hypothetical protein